MSQPLYGHSHAHTYDYTLTWSTYNHTPVYTHMHINRNISLLTELSPYKVSQKAASFLSLIKYYRSITLTDIAAKIYNALLLNHFKPEIDKILWNNQNGFQREVGVGSRRYVNTNKMDYMCFNWKRAISTSNGSPLKLVDKFSYLSGSISYTESDVNMYLGMVYTAIDRLFIIWKSEISDKIKWDYFQAVVVSILLYGCTTWMLTKNIEKKLDGSCTTMLWAILNKSWKQQQLYGHLPPISKTIQV